MTELLTAAQMRAIEQAAIDSGEVTGLELMERAGRGVVDAILEEWPELATTSHRAVVLCGPGNNGGDGFVVARLLKERGWEVEVFLYGDADKLPPDAKVNAKRWQALGSIRPSDNFDTNGAVDLAVDALFGSGLTRHLEGEALELVGEIGGERVVAIDCLSGMCVDSGRLLAPPDPILCQADLTVTFHSPKIGHLLADGPSLSGRVDLRDIGIDRRNSLVVLRAVHDPKSDTLRDPAAVVRLLTRDPHDVHMYGRQGKPQLKKGTPTHKYTHGHALILSGPPGATGAARLAARGALRIGAGLVTLGVPPAAQLECASQLTAVMLTRTPDANALAETLQDSRINALCIGPGFGTGEREAAILATALGRRAEARPTDDESVGRGSPRRNCPTILDADALTLLATHTHLFDALHADCVLTPHAGEFKRLFPDIAEKLDAPATTGPAYSKVDAAREAAARAGCVVLFKGPDTVIADPSGRAAVNASSYDRAAPWLATAGSGDVLAGFVAGLLARGFAPMQAAETAAWLHTECALKFGPGLIAEDLPEELPRVLRDLGL